MSSQALHTVQTAKHGGGGEPMIWACFATTGPWKHAVIGTPMNNTLYYYILETNLRPSVQQLRLSKNGSCNRRMN